MKKYRVEFNTTGYYAGQGIFETLDELCGMECENEQEAIECAIDWFTENDERFGDGETDVDEIKAEYESYAWRAAEEIETEYGTEYGEWKFDE